MRRYVTALRGDVILASDGDMGLVVDLYFDDERWNVRYLVVDTGHVMPERRVLIAPGAVEPGQPSDKLIRVRLTRNEVEHSPEAKTALPSRFSSTCRSSVAPRPIRTCAAARCSSGSRSRRSTALRATSGTSSSTTRPGRSKGSSSTPDGSARACWSRPRR